jgi:hypothetical protein
MTDTKQPEALRLAQSLEGSPYLNDKIVAAELRRLHEVNQELLKALKLLLSLEEEGLRGHDDIDVCYEMRQAREAIAKAEGSK